MMWKEIKGYEDLYQVSDSGAILSLTRNIRMPKGGVRIDPEKRLKCFKTRTGYIVATLIKNGKTKRFCLHRLVADAFIPNPYKKPEVNHIDGNKGNNSVANLEWCTKSENREHAVRTGLRKHGYGKPGRINELNTRSRRVMQYDLKNQFIKEWPSVQEVQRALGFRSSNVGAAARGKINSAYGFYWKY